MRSRIDACIPDRLHAERRRSGPKSGRRKGVGGQTAASFESHVTPLDIDVSNAQLHVLAFAIVGDFVLIDGLQMRRLRDTSC